MRPRPPPESGLSGRIYITKRMMWPGVNGPYIFFHVIFIKIKLSSRLCLTHKIVTQKQKFYIDKIKNLQKKFGLIAIPNLFDT